MPTFTYGSNTDLFWNGYDVTRMFRKVDAERNRDTADVTCFGDTARRIQVGLVDGKLSAEGIYDNDATAGTPDADTQLLAAFDTPYPAISYCPEGAAIGLPVEVIEGVEVAYSVESPVTDITAVKAEAASRHGLERCLSLHDMIAEAAGTVNSASVDNGASSANGIVAVVHVTAVTAGNVVVKVQHSTDNVTFVDLVTFNAVASGGGAPAAQRLVVAGTVNRFLRAQAVVTTGPATYHVAAGRTPRNG